MYFEYWAKKLHDFQINVVYKSIFDILKRICRCNVIYIDKLWSYIIGISEVKLFIYIFSSSLEQIIYNFLHNLPWLHCTETAISWWLICSIKISIIIVGYQKCDKKQRKYIIIITILMEHLMRNITTATIKQIWTKTIRMGWNIVAILSDFCT